MSQPLAPVLSRWEIDPPIIHAQEVRDHLNAVIGVLNEQLILRPTISAARTDCTECGERCRVVHIADKNGDRHGYIHCGHCGIAEVSAESLKRWSIDTKAFLSAVFAGVETSLQERVPRQLWMVGKATWAGRSRELWFARAFRQGAIANSLNILNRRPKAILFTPTEAGAERWHGATANLVIALESALALNDDAIRLDVDFVEGRIVDAGMGPGAASKPRQKMRASRATNIEALKQEMIKHLRAARNHAFDTRDRTGKPELLRRPQMKDLATLTGLRKDQVTKCFQDSRAAELNLYWNIAADLDVIMKWKGPVKRGRAS